MLRRLVVFLIATLVAAIIAFYVGKYLENHDLLRADFPLWRYVVHLLDFLGFVINSKWFWSVLWGLSGFAFGTYFDALVRRCAPKQPITLSWYDPVDAINEFVDSKLLLESDNLRKQLERLSVETGTRKKRLDDATSQWPFGPNSPKYDSEIDVLREAWQATTKAAHETGEALWRKNQEILDALIRQLKTGRLIAKAFRTNDHRIVQSDEPQIIPTSQWVLLTFDTYDQKRQTVTGPGLGYRGLQIGVSKSAN